MDTKVKDLVSTAMGKIKEISDADTIIGDPIKIDPPKTKRSASAAAAAAEYPFSLLRLSLLRTAM